MNAISRRTLMQSESGRESEGAHTGHGVLIAALQAQAARNPLLEQFAGPTLAMQPMHALDP